MRPMMSRRKYLAYIAKQNGGNKVSLPKKWSETEKRYFNGVLKRTGAYEGETIRITPSNVERHEYTPDFVTEIITMQALTGMMGKSFVAPAFPIKRTVYHEVKGHYRLQSQDAARLRWCFAAMSRPESIFVWSKEQSHGLWQVEVWYDGGRTRVKERDVIDFEFKQNGGIVWHKREKQAKRHRA